MKTIGSHLAALLAGRGSVRRQLAPFVRYVVLLTAVVLLYGWLFHVIMAWEGQDHTWFTGIYWALTVMSTLGFGDITFATDLGRVFSSIVLLTGIVLLLIILPFLFIRFVYAPWLEQRVRTRVTRLRSVADEISGHVLICSDDPIAPGLIRRLQVAGVPVFLIEPDPDRATQLHDAGVPVVIGEVDSIETYRRMGADRASLVLANASDTLNSNIVLTVRELSETVPVVALAEVEDSVDVLELSGATHVLNLTHQLGEHLANRVTAGSARANVIGDFHDLLLAEFPVHNTPLQGRTIGEAGLEEFCGVKILGTWQGGRLLPATPETKLTPLSVPVVVGTPSQIQELDEVLVIYDANPSPVLIIGGGKVGRSAARALKRRDTPVHIVEKNPDLEPLLAGIPDQIILGDAADRRVLERAGIEEAPSILLTTHDDAMNVYLTVYCRRLNPESRILTRVTHARNIEAIQRAGANFVLSYASLGVQTLFSIARGGHNVVLGEGVNLFEFPLPAPLVGKRLADANIEPRTGLNVIAVCEDGALDLEIAPHRRLRSGAELVAIGSTEQRESFRSTFE